MSRPALPAARGAWLGALLACAAGGLLWLGTEALDRSDPLVRAWRAVEAAGAYRFEGWSRAAAGEQAWTHRFRGRGDGAGDLELELLLETEGQPADAEASARSTAADGLPAPRYRLRWPEARRLEVQRWRHISPRTLAALLPGGDPLASLAAAQGVREEGLERVGGRDCRRLSFRLAGRAQQRWWQRQRRYWPPAAEDWRMERVTGEGRAWLDPSDGLPCRIQLQVELPRLAGEQPGWGESDLRYDFDRDPR